MSDADRYQLVDTNILIFAHDSSAGEKNRRANALLRRLWQERNGCLSVQVLQEFYVNVTQKVAQPLNPALAAQIIADLSVWRVHQPGVEDVLDAIQIQSRYQLSFWDAMIVNSALQLGCQTIWTEDMNTGQSYDGVIAENPF
ncbi:MAG: PIN domain-containing protein [Chloroflexota bacterium]|nr:PIN domain-containing protein [Chloroflexota bacterium]